MSLFRRLWWELKRPRGHVSHRFYRSGRRSRAGVALVMVMTTILFMSVLVMEISYAATVRVTLAGHTRDEVMAEGLAHTGVHLYQLILVASKQLGSNEMLSGMASSLGFSIGDTLWQLVPFINTGLLRMMLVSGPGSDREDIAEIEEEGGLTEEEIDESRENKGSERNFLDFDGDFFAEVADEDKKINIATIQANTYADLMTEPTALALYSLMSGMRDRRLADPFYDASMVSDQEQEEIEDHDQFFYEKSIERWELIGNLADWTDTDNERLYQGGAEDSLYNNLEDPYLPKNAGFDTLLEVRLVDGWHDDDVWERYGEHLTVYGSGKVNMNTAQYEVLWALLKAYNQGAPDTQIDEMIAYVQQYKAMSTFQSADSFTTYLQNAYPTVDPAIKQAVTTQSTVFRVTSTGQVNEATVTIEAVLDFNQSSLGKVVYWRVQ